MRKTATIIDGLRQNDIGIGAADDAKANSDEIARLVRAPGAIIVAAQGLADDEFKRSRRVKAFGLLNS
jgi:hypothetical protein